ncbi:transcription factor bHLH112-like isoform X2 [Tasmannia lanceolata]|uniref:transcription factor bHLH112-like isoform X2 n=1 Tax=Tasmannia lanceolata TaxID=3420 RepID=UPI0040646B12
MADDFQAGICSGNWWNSERNRSNESSLPCSTVLNDVGWVPSDLSDIKMRSCEESASVSRNPIVFQDAQNSQSSDSVGGSTVLIDSTLQMAGFGLSPQSINWNQDILPCSGRAESSYHEMLQEESAQVQKDWSPKIFSSRAEDSSFKQINQGFTLKQQCLNSGSSAGDCTVTCQGLPSNNFSMNLGSYVLPSTLLQGFFEPDLQPHQIPYENLRAMNYQSPVTYCTNSNEFSLPTWPKIPQFLQNSPPKQQPSNQLHFSNNAAFWNASTSGLNDFRSSFFPSTSGQFVTQTFEEKPNCSSVTSKMNIEEVRDSCLTMTKSSEPAFKRPRIETPSPLPTFKVRKEKLGDRITALQQLVSPFGKTDTASVLVEAIDYIKFLHDQVLSTPYMKNGAPIQHQQSSDKSKDPEGPKQDLRSRGLCLVPISSTFPVTNETTTDFWTPTFGGTFR